MVGGRSVRTVDGNDIHSGQHLIEALPIGRSELLFDDGRHAAAVVVMDLKPECPCTTRDRLPDTSHPYDAQPLAPNAVAQHPGRRPAAPGFVVDEHSGAFSQTTRNREDQRHGHIGGILGQHPRRIRYRNTATQRRRNVDMIDAVSVVGDQLESVSGLAEYRRVDAVGHRGDEHIRALHCVRKLGDGQRPILEIKLRVEQFAHPRFNSVRQLARHHDKRPFAICHDSTLAGPQCRCQRRVILHLGLFNPAA